MKIKDMETKHIIGLIAAITAVAALITGAVVLAKKYLKKQKCKKYYIECDCENDTMEISGCDDNEDQIQECQPVAEETL